MAIEGLLQAQGNILQRRTLQRRLAFLVEQERIQTVGEARAVRHRVATNASNAHRTATVAGDTFQATAEVYAPPVGYELAFLEQYHPNHTAYLSPELRNQLHALGRSPADQAPAGTFARAMLNRLLIDLSRASSQLEGKNALETQMILNHKQAIEYLVGDPNIAILTPEAVISLHALLSDGLMEDPVACGRIRLRAVEIGGSVYMPVTLAQRLEELFGIVMIMAAEISDPFEQAFF